MSDSGKLAIKLYNNEGLALSDDDYISHKAKKKLKRLGSDALTPYYGEVRSSNDIHALGEESRVNKKGTGFAAIGFPRGEGISPLESRRQFEDLLSQVLDYDVETLDNNDIALTKVRLYDLIEDDEKYKEARKKQKAIDEDILAYIDKLKSENDGIYEPDKVREYRESKYPDFSGDTIDGYDVQRDGEAEFRGRRIKPEEILKLVRRYTPDEIKNLAKGVSRFGSKKDVFRYLREHNVSPFAMSSLIANLSEELDESDINEHLKDGVKEDAFRQLLEEIFKHENDYVSDLRTKRLIPSITQRFL